MIKIASLWRPGKEGSKVIYRGKVDVPCPIILEKGMVFVLFENKSDHEKAPVLDILLAEDTPRPQTQANPNSDVEF